MMSSLEIADLTGKRLDHFWENRDTTAYMVALADQLKVNPGIPGINPCFKATGYHALKGSLVETQRGHHTHANVGTWPTPSWPCSSPAGWTRASLSGVTTKPRA
ncbi:MAG: hypothetical protein ACOZE7_21015 [Pseudomonadota bacterium]